MLKIAFLTFFCCPQQRLLHTKRLKKEILKLEKMENDLTAASAASATSTKPEKVALTISPFFIAASNRSFRVKCV
jgi:uncharacterized protein YdaU (DUF1376 family)